MKTACHRFGVLGDKSCMLSRTGSHDIPAARVQNDEEGIRAMSEWVKVAAEEDLDEVLGVEVEGKSFALFRLEDGIYALDDVCSHEYSRLSEGDIWDDEVYCPKHGSRFDIRTGKNIGLPATKPVGTYPVKVENGVIFLELE